MHMLMYRLINTLCWKIVHFMKLVDMREYSFVTVFSVAATNTHVIFAYLLTTIFSECSNLTFIVKSVIFVLYIL